MKKNKIIILLLAASVFCSGAASLINELILSSISTMIMGNAIEQFSLTIGLMLFAMGIGGFSQQFVNDKFLIQKFIVLEIILAIVGSFSPIAMYAAFAYTPEHYDLINYGCIFAIGFMIGFEIPFIIRMVEKYNSILKNNLGTIFSSDYVGAFVGTLLWVFVLLSNVPFTEAGFFVSGSNLFVAIATYIFFVKNEKILEIEAIEADEKEDKEERIKLVTERKGSKLNYLLPIILVFVIGSIYYGYKHNRDWSISLEQKLFKDPIIFSSTTKYQHLVMTENKSLDELRLYINGNVQFSSLDEKRYHEMLIHPVMSLAKKHDNILILGGGDGLAVRELKKYNDIKNITLIDLDPKMIEFSKTNKRMVELNKNAFKGVNVIIPENYEDSRKERVYMEKEHVATVDIVNVDAGKFLYKIQNTKWDIVIIDLPDPSAIELVKLYSKEMYMSLLRVMNKEALVVIQATSPYHAKESFLCIGRTFEAAGFDIMPMHHNIPSFGDWGWFIASNKDASLNLRRMANDLEEFSVETDYLTPNLFKSSLEFGKGELVSKNNKINTWMEPVLLDIYTKNSWLSY